MKTLISLKQLSLLSKIEVILLIVAIIGVPLAGPVVNYVSYRVLPSFGLYELLPEDLNGLTTSIYLKEGDTIMITIQSYTLDYSISGNHTGFSFEPGIFLKYWIEDYMIKIPVAVTNEHTNVSTFAGYECIYDYNSLYREAPLFLRGTNAFNESFRLEIIDANRTHAMVEVIEMDLKFPIKLYSIHTLAFANPKIAPGIKIVENDNDSNVFIAWFGISVFSTETTRIHLEVDSRKPENCANSFEKIAPDTFRFPREKWQEGYITAVPPKPFTVWKLYPNSPKIEWINSTHQFDYTWNDTFYPGGSQFSFNLSANMSISLELQYQ
jgi:hypothetical protein